MGSNSGESMDACKCIVPLWHEGTLNSHRASSSLMSDNGPQLISDVFEHLSHRLDIKHIKTVTYRPQVNLTERVNRTLVQMIACFVEENHDNWDRDSSMSSLSRYAQHISVTDGAEYVGGKIEILFDEARQNMQKQHKTWEKYYNRKRREVNIKVNDLVLVQAHFISYVDRRVVGKFMPKFEGPYRVLEVWNNNLTIRKKGRRVTVNIDQVRMYHPRHSDTNSSIVLMRHYMRERDLVIGRIGRTRENPDVLENPRLMRGPETLSGPSNLQQMKKLCPPKEESRRGARVQSDRARETRTTVNLKSSHFRAADPDHCTENTDSSVNEARISRPRVTTPNEDRYLAVTAKRNRRSTASYLSRQLSSATGTTVSRQIVYRRLGHIGLYARRPFLLSDSHRTLIWRVPGTRYHQENIIERHRSGGAGWLVWGGIILGSRTDLHVLSVTMTGHIYRDVILQQHVRLFRGAMGAEFLFMDDNARAHHANIVDECLQSEDITRIDWPAYSPDLNPIEHVWDMLGRRTTAHQPPPTCLPELRRALLDEWFNIPQDQIDNLILSIPRYCKACIASSGRYTLY
ncbi:transposable element Tc3 transposase [Trichonephila clavipes]|nr:transposable element Tc3 transposase [Trichonephila clavipes]